MSEDEFTLTIRLGNDAMKTPLDVAIALRQVANDVEHGWATSGTVRDGNGNTVGGWTGDGMES